MKPKERKQFTVGQPVYLTRYALTKGIKVVKMGPRYPETAPGYHRLADHGDLYVDAELHATLPAAQQEAMRMAARALKALKKRRARLTNILRAGAKVTQ